MRVFLDTTYLLPFVGIEVEEIPQEFLESLFGSDNILVINELSLFELMGKALKVLKGKDAKERFNVGVKSIMESDRIKRYPIFTLDSFSVAMELHEKGLDDLSDRPITASALCYSDLMLTEADDIPIIVRKVDAKFKVMKWAMFQEEFLS
ncbi:MAG: hypothetical protein KKI07_02375 [Euryarchaeota archaeon]|nr:hypothetical protein [Euryarchaeota archaeon]MDI6859182.1 hypothetical protein [Methanocellales archaeon]MDI6902398.1 hypothetical protein [Methanocellales archaeon]